MRFKVTYSDPGRPTLTITALISARSMALATLTAAADHPEFIVDRVERFRRKQ